MNLGFVLDSCLNAFAKNCYTKVDACVCIVILSIGYYNSIAVFIKLIVTVFIIYVASQDVLAVIVVYVVAFFINKVSA